MRKVNRPQEKDIFSEAYFFFFFHTEYIPLLICYMALHVLLSEIIYHLTIWVVRYETAITDSWVWCTGCKYSKKISPALIHRAVLPTELVHKSLFSSFSFS